MGKSESDMSSFFAGVFITTLVYMLIVLFIYCVDNYQIVRVN